MERKGYYSSTCPNPNPRETEVELLDRSIFLIQLHFLSPSLPLLLSFLFSPSSSPLLPSSPFLSSPSSSLPLFSPLLPILSFPLLSSLPSFYLQIPVTREVLSSLPNVLGAMCLNARGLQTFLDAKPFDHLFGVLISPQYLSAMRRKKGTDQMGMRKGRG